MLLTAALAGWGGSVLLPSYELERHPVGLRNCEAAGAAAMGVRTWSQACPPEIAEDSPRGEDARRRIAALADIELRKLHEMTNTELGYRYVGSPLICTESDTPPEGGPTEYVPSTVPGARLPHVWLADGAAVHDRIDWGYTPLRLGGTSADTSALEQALKDTGAPFSVLVIDEPRVPELYERDLLLVRPDLHVAWRGDTPPTDPAQVAAIITGHAVVV